MSNHEDLLVLVQVAAELIEPEDVAVFAREFAQFAVELTQGAVRPSRTCHRIVRF